eukprot:2187848-Prymnesium_polylepis.1
MPVMEADSECRKRGGARTVCMNPRCDLRPPRIGRLVRAMSSTARLLRRDSMRQTHVMTRSGGPTCGLPFPPFERTTRGRSRHRHDRAWAHAWGPRAGTASATKWRIAAGAYSGSRYAQRTACQRSATGARLPSARAGAVSAGADIARDEVMNLA